MAAMVSVLLEFYYIVFALDITLYFENLLIYLLILLNRL